MRKNKLLLIPLLLMLIFALCACGEPKASAEYDRQTIVIEFPDGSEKALSLAEMKGLEQHQMHGDCIRTTGTIDEYEVTGAYLRDILTLAGTDISKYEGVSITGIDGYYCLFSQEALAQAEPETLISFVINNKAELDKEYRPAMVVAQGLYGPYWVKMVNRIILLDNIPEKEITSVWCFSNLTKDITPMKYEYWGSQDDAIDLEQVWARFDNVDVGAFFTMKSSDGFMKNEAMNMVLKRYYIKTTGIEAPTNINPNIALGMNVQYLAWFSSNADACIFPEEMEKFLTISKDGAVSGVAFDDILTETQAEIYADNYYEFLSLDGDSYVVKAEDLANCLLYIAGEKKYNVHFNGGVRADMEDFLRVRLSDKESYDAQQKPASAAQVDKTTAPAVEKTTAPAVEKTTAPAVEKTTAPAVEKTTAPAVEKTTAPAVEKTTAPVIEKTTAPTIEKPALPAAIPAAKEGEEKVLKLFGDALTYEVELTLSQLKGIEGCYYEGIFSQHNNFPTNKASVGKGIDFGKLLSVLGIKDAENALICLTASDGYYAELTGAQVMSERYYFPKLKDGKTDGAVVVPALIAWAYKSGANDLAKAKEDGLNFVIGQSGLNDMNTAAAVQSLASIEVKAGKTVSWQQPVVEAVVQEDGTLSVSLKSDEIDSVKYYYTTDGSTPTYASAQYNPSTSFYKPELTVPIIMPKDATLKVLASALGKADSEILVWQKGE